MSAAAVQIDGVRAEAFRVPTEQPESDGTYEWDSVTVVVAEADAGGQTGLGYTYTDAAAAAVITGTLAGAVKGGDAMATGAAWWSMVGAIRNLGWPGISATAISAVDVSLWDLKAKLLDVSVADLLGRSRDAVPVYGSGGLTSYPQSEVCEQLAGWVAQGIPRVKMKVGREPDADPTRVRAAREAIGDDAELFVDANGAYSRKQALALAETYAQEAGVSWFEEPVSSADFAGLRLVREQGPGGLDVAAGEYGYVLADFRNLLDAGAVDCLQADVTRCGGITGLLQASGLASAHGIDLSGHCAPSVSVSALCAIERLRHLEWFHDHVRVEALLFDGVLEVQDGRARPDLSRPGHGLELKRSDAARWAA